MGLEPLEKLGSKDTLFQLLLDSIPIGVAVIDRDMQLRYINQRHANLNYIDPETDLNRHIRDYLPQIADIVEQKMGYVFETGKPLLHQEIKSPSNALFYGKPIHRRVSYYPWKNSHGEVRAILALIQDSSVDHFVEHILQESERRLLSVLNNLPAYIGVLDLNGYLLDKNLFFSETIMQAGSSITPRYFWDYEWWCHSQETIEQISAGFQQVLKGSSVRLDVTMYLPSSDRYIWVDLMLAPLVDSSGQLVNCIVSATDMTQRHASEMKLRESEERYRLLFESSDDAIITKSLASMVLDLNPAAEALFGYTREELIGRHISVLFPSEKIEEEVNIIHRIQRGERVPSFETVRVCKNGQLLDVSVTISPIVDGFGKVIGACKIARDISVQKQNQRLLEKTLADKTSLLHEVHHRVKNNLQIVSSLLNLQSRKSEPVIQSALQESQMRIKAMALVHQLLYESEQMANINLVDYLKRLVGLITSTYHSHDNRLKIQFTSSELEIHLDIQRIIPCGLILNELLTNAIKHAFPHETAGHIDIQLGVLESSIQLEIIDNGVGLPADFDWGGQTTLGKQLIPMFVKQLKGSISRINVSTGTHLSVEFPMNHLEV